MNTVRLSLDQGSIIVVPSLPPFSFRYIRLRGGFLKLGLTGKQWSFNRGMIFGDKLRDDPSFLTAVDPNRNERGQLVLGLLPGDDLIATYSDGEDVVKVDIFLLDITAEDEVELMIFAPPGSEVKSL